VQAPKSKMNPCHAVPLTRLGIISQHCSANPPGEAIPAIVRHCGKASVNSVTLCCPLFYGPRAAPSKEDSGTLEKGMDACLAPAQDDAVTSDQ
jgi:hypothetical protein